MSTRAFCEAQWNRDIFHCKMVGLPSCYAQAMVRLVACEKGEPIPPLRSRKGLWLLALLALRYERDVPRDWLAETLWPDSSSAQALSSLRRTLTDLRRALGREAARLTSPNLHALRLRLDRAFLDVAAFDSLTLIGNHRNAAYKHAEMLFIKRVHAMTATMTVILAHIKHLPT